MPLEKQLVYSLSPKPSPSKGGAGRRRGKQEPNPALLMLSGLQLLYCILPVLGRATHTMLLTSALPLKALLSTPSSGTGGGGPLSIPPAPLSARNPPR